MWDIISSLVLLFSAVCFVMLVVFSIINSISENDDDWYPHDNDEKFNQFK